MITTQDIKKIYEWAKVTSFPLKKAPTIKGGYCNKDVYLVVKRCWETSNDKKEINDR